MKRLTCILLLFCLNASAQQIATSLHDSMDTYIFSNPEKALVFSNSELRLSDPNSKTRVRALLDLGICHYYSDEYDIGRSFLTKARQLAEKIHDDDGKAWALFYTGDLEILEGKYGNAVEHISRAQSLFNKTDNSKGKAMCLNGLGAIHLQQQNYEKAMSYFKGALKYGDQITKGDSYANLSKLYLEMEGYAGAKSSAKNALRLGIQNEDQYVQSTAYDVLGTIELKRGNFTAAESYLQKAIKLKLYLDDQQGLAISYVDLAKAKRATGQPDSAAYFSLLSFNIASNIGAKEEIKNAAFLYSKILATRGLYDSAFYYQNQYIQLNTELFNQKVSKKMAEMEAAISIKENNHRITMLEHEKEFAEKSTRLYLTTGIIGIVLLSITVFFVFNRYRFKKKSHDKLAATNAIIEHQNTEILQSIRYAKRLQEAILPEKERIQRVFPKSFVSYLPKDIVAGDFYWFEETTSGYLLACCDCTGHGVPGAMVSIVCSNAMNRAVREMKRTIPGELLDETRQMVVENFNQHTTESQVKDGMDIGLLSFSNDLSTVQFAGAHHALWILRPDADDFEIVKGNKAPVGKFDRYEPFSTHALSLKPGDRLYLFTDGYADQFGGEEGKKMKTPTVRQYILSIRQQSLTEQQQLLEDFFFHWKGTEDQVDDVCFMGVEI
ncbi:MAG: tetratricopeptide repeat protein [Fluviicola sp.]|nr:tetratricopeptide repeat protein [Fluviicola sp.]